MRRYLCTAVLLLVATRVGASCLGDCNGNGTIDQSEVTLAVRLLFDPASADGCDALNAPGTGISEPQFFEVIDNALHGCPVGLPEPTPTPVVGAAPICCQCGTNFCAGELILNGARRCGLCQRIENATCLNEVANPLPGEPLHASGGTVCAPLPTPTVPAVPAWVRRHVRRERHR